MRANIVSLVLGLIAVVLLLVNNNINWGPNDWKGAIEADARGYYAYLPATFIYNDYNFHFLKEVESKYAQTHLNYDYRRKVEGKWVNKYYCGVAVAQMPFFFLAHAITSLDNHQDNDGYSKWYMQFISLSAIFYQLLGLFFLSKLMQLFQLKKWVIAFCLIICSFGTNLYVYTIVEAGMSHVYSFAFISLFLYLVKRYASQPNKTLLLKMSLTFGLIVLIRPVNGLVLLAIPFIVGSWKALVNFLHNLVQSRKALLLGIFLFVAILFIQLIYYYLATDNLWVYSYTNEGFNFLSPKMIEILFSWKKGLFLYTPIYLIGTIAAIGRFKSSSFQTFTWIIFFVGITYVFSAWWMWFYGGSFSSRVYVEFLALFILPIGYCLNEMRAKFLKNTFISLLVLLTLLCQIQSYQYRYYDIHYSEMTQEKYWEVFLLRNRFN